MQIGILLIANDKKDQDRIARIIQELNAELTKDE